MDYNVYFIAKNGTKMGYFASKNLIFGTTYRKNHKIDILFANVIKGSFINDVRQKLRKYFFPKVLFSVGILF